MKKIAYILAIFFFFSCEKEEIKEDYQQLLQLKWNKAYEEDTIDKAVIGLQWALSYVGANTPSKTNSITVTDNLISLNLNNLGFSEAAKKAFEKLEIQIIDTEAYNKNKSIDLGRFVTLLLGSPEIYYTLIETPKTLGELKENYILNPKKGYINNSSIAHVDRVISFSEQKEFNQLWISEETDPITKTVYEIETIELLKNGQLRFGIYDNNGVRKNSANKEHTRAGKPGKCIWCHESNLNPLFKEQNDFNGFLTSQELQKIIISSRETFNLNKTQLKYNVDYTNKQQHTLAELLYISFLEPSAERLSLEWNMDITEVTSLLSNIKPHNHDEFSFLEDLYYRKDIESFAPYKAVPVSENVREE